MNTLVEYLATCALVAFFQLMQLKFDDMREIEYYKTSYRKSVKLNQEAFYSIQMAAGQLFEK
jgi:hypothetical protein